MVKCHCRAFVRACGGGIAIHQTAQRAARDEVRCVFCLSSFSTFLRISVSAIPDVLLAFAFNLFILACIKFSCIFPKLSFIYA